jgi:hypothetical protein
MRHATRHFFRAVLRTLFWPVRVLNRLVLRLAARVMGRLLVIAVGLLLIAIGFTVSLTICGAIGGIPVMLAGAFMIVRALLPL